MSCPSEKLPTSNLDWLAPKPVSLGVHNNPYTCSMPANISLLQMQSHGEEFCRINKDGRLIRNDIDITDNDKAMAECFVDYLKKIHKVQVKRGS